MCCPAAVGVKVLVDSLKREAWKPINMGEHEVTIRIETAKAMMHWLCLSQYLDADTRRIHTELLSQRLGRFLLSKIWSLHSNDSAHYFPQLTGTSCY